MSEYSKFLNYFNTKKGSAKTGQGDGGQPPAPPEPTEPKEEKTAAMDDLAAKTDIAFSKAESRYIKQPDAEVISAGAPEEQPASGPEVETFADRFETDAEEHTGYTGKINTAEANREPVGDLPAEDEGHTKIIPGSVFEEAMAAQQSLSGFAPEEGATKHIELPADEPAAEQAAEPPTKHIGSGKGSLLMEIAKSNAEEVGEDPDQLILEGFFNEDEEKKEAQERSEKEMRRELSKTRQKRINDFHFWSKAGTEAGKSPDGAFASGPESNSLPEMLRKFTSRFENIESGALHFSCDEYKDPNEHRAVFKKLMEIRRNTVIRAAIVGLLGLILLLINISASVSAAKNNGFFTIMGGSATAYVTTNLIFLALASFVVFNDIKEGIISLLQGHPKTDASLVFMLTVSFIQLVSAYLTKQNLEADFHLLTGAAILMCVPLLLAKAFYYDNTRHCFKSIAAKSEKAYLRKLSDRNLVSAVLGGADNGSEEVVYAGRTRFIRGFIHRSRSSAAGGQISSRITLIAMAAAFLTGIIAMILRGSVMWGLSVMCFAAVLSLPVGCLFFTGFMIANENKALSVKSSFVRSYSDARDLAKVDNLVLRAEDIFSVEITETVCIDGVNRQQAELCAALITEKTGGLLKKAFRIPEALKESKLPEAEQLTYEDKLGFSAWISDCRVLLGSNAFLSNHNVRMPDESGVLNFIDTENKPIYLAIEGHFTAMFSAKYSCASEHVKQLKTLADNGANILIVSSDPNITDTFAEKLLGLPADSVRVISKNAAEKLAAQQSTVTDSEDTGIVFSGGDSLCRCAFSAVKLDKLKKLSKLICEICCCAGVALALLFTIAGTTSVVSGWLAVLLQLLGMALCFFLPPLLTASSMPAFSQSAVRPVARKEAFTPENFVPRPKKIENEEEEDETPEETGDEDVKIAPEPGQAGRFARFRPAPAWEDDDDDDDELPARRQTRVGKLMRSRLAKKSGQDKWDDEAPQAEPAREPLMAKVPENPDDIDLSTEDLLQTSYFRDEEAGEEPVRRAPSPANEYEEETDRAPAYEAGGYDEYDDDDDLFGDGVLGKLRSRIKHGKGSRSAYDEYDDEPDYDDEPLYDAPQRGGKKGLNAAALSGTVKGLSSKVAAFTKNIGKKGENDPGYDYDEYDDEPAERDPQPYGSADRQPAGARPSILSFAEEQPAPPHYELGRTDDYDFLNVKFEPPAIKTGDYYNDAFFSRYDTDTVENDADAVFSGLKETEE
ncbi:MAG: hypothetical protein IJK89_09605 [Clostridia bacterium]|nr:hypothetical protein [Clostridia bacterium]